MLRTLPWARVDIEMVSVETDLAGRVMEGSRGDIIEYMRDQGYIHRWVDTGNILGRYGLYTGLDIV